MFPLPRKPHGVVIAAPRSGSGKTAVTLGLLRALKRRGLSVQPFKCGPDYIDPAFHEAACGRPSYNLDSWAMRKETVLKLLNEAQDADFIVAEALMGLFDGVAQAGQWGIGASAEIAALAGLPVILVLDVSGQAQTAAAVARGFAGLQPGVEIAGVILNRAGSPRHERLARTGFERTGMPVFGAIPRKEAIALPERHLGLVQAGEIAGLSANLDALADLVEACIDIGAMLMLDGVTNMGNLPSPCPSPGQARLGELATLGCLHPLADADGRGDAVAAGSPCPLSHGERAGVRGDSLDPQMPPPEPAQRANGLAPPGQRIALAQDAAFSFVYPHLLKAWRDAGAEILPFSPLADEAPAGSADAVWLPGGYPELHAGRLAANSNFLAGVRAFAGKGPVHGECGGYMVLGNGLADAKGERHAMLGLLRLETSFAERKLHLGYRKAELLAYCILGRRGDRFAGHEFHYCTVLAEQGEALFSVADAEGAPVLSTGLRHGNVTGSFFHLIDCWG